MTRKPGREREDRGHRESSLDVAEDHHVLPADRDLFAPERTQDREAAVDGHGTTDVKRKDRSEDRTRFGQEHARIDLHSHELEEEDVDAETDGLPEALKREHTRRLERVTCGAADHERSHDDRDDRRRMDALGEERRRKHEHARGEDPGQVIRGPPQRGRTDPSEDGADRDAADDRKEQRARRRCVVDVSCDDDRAREAHEDERRAVVEETLTFHDRREPVRNANAPEREEDADGIGDGEQSAEEEGGRERQAERERRYARGGDERDHDARSREREDRPARFPEAVSVGEERGLEDEDGKERDEDDVWLERCVRQDVREDEEKTDHYERDVVRNADALRPDGDGSADAENEDVALEHLPHARPPLKLR